MCNLCENEKFEDQRHVIECDQVENNRNININYSDLFNKNIDILKITIEKYEKSWKQMCDLKAKKIAENESTQNAN